MGVDDRGDGVGGVVETVDELEAESNEQGYDEQHERPDAGDGDAAEVLGDVNPNVAEADDHRGHDYAAADHGVGFLHLLVKQCRGGGPGRHSCR